MKKFSKITGFVRVPRKGCELLEARTVLYEVGTTLYAFLREVRYDSLDALDAPANSTILCESVHNSASSYERLRDVVRGPCEG